MNKAKTANQRQNVYLSENVRTDDMAVANHKRGNTTLYIDPNDINSHRMRIVLAEKSVPVTLIQTNGQSPLPADLLRLNPYGILPTFIDRDLALYGPNIIAEYLDERFPHPSLLPVYPIERAKMRLMISRIEKEWYSLVKKIQCGMAPEAKQARQKLSDSLVNFSPIFSSMPYFLSEEFSLLDCCVIPLLHALPKYNITLPSASAKSIQKYMERMVTRPSFLTSVSQIEPEYEFA